MDSYRFIKLIIIINIVLSLLLITDTGAQQIEISSTLNPVGSGARAMGMGGAFIGVADDATAASWNPAGLIQLEKPEISLAYSYFHTKRAYNPSALTDIDSDNITDAEGLNYASITVPFVLLDWKNMVFSLNYQRVYEMNKELNITFQRSGSGANLLENNEFVQDGVLYTFSPAIALEITQTLSLGVTVNFWNDLFGDNGWSTNFEQQSNGEIFSFPVEFKVSEKSDVSFEGINAHIGFLWSFHESFTLGGIIKTPFDADLNRQVSSFQSQDWPSFPLLNESTNESDKDYTMKMPLSYGIGLSYRHSDELTIALDVYITDWSEYIIEDETGNKVNPLDGRLLTEGELNDTTQVRLGAEYLIIRADSLIPIRFGLFYDPEPAKGSPDDYYGVTFGSGYAKGKIAIDAAYEYRSGNNVTSDFPIIQDLSTDVHQHFFLLSAIFYLK